MGQYQNIIFIVAIVAAFWFLIFRPQQQRQKQHAEMMSSIQEGAEIITIGGIYATVVEVGDDRLRVAIADGSEMEIASRAVASVVPLAADDSEAEQDEADDADGADGADDAPALDAPAAVTTDATTSDRTDDASS